MLFCMFVSVVFCLLGYDPDVFAIYCRCYLSTVSFPLCAGVHLFRVSSLLRNGGSVESLRAPTYRKQVFA